MPRLRKTAAETTATRIRALVKSYQIERGFDDSDLVAGLGISLATYYRKMKDPTQLTVGDLLSIQRRLKIPHEKLMEALEQ